MNREEITFSVSPFAPENSSREMGLAVSSRVCLPISILRLNLVLTCEIPLDFRGGVHLRIVIAIRHRVSPKLIGSRSCVPIASTAEHLPTQGQ